MRRLARAAWTIARRDYVATVVSRTFLLFLIGPLLPLLFGGLFGVLTADEGRAGPPPPIAVRATPADFHLLDAARARLTARLGRDWLPPLADYAHPDSMLLTGGLERPRLGGPHEAVGALGGRVGLLVDTARGLRGGLAPPVALVLAPDASGKARAADPRDLARGAQFGMFLLTIILAGMLISNLVEEKSSKVIEVLAAAVPVDAIFLGKLVGMLGVSLTGILVWGTAGAAGGALLLPRAALGAPAVGWPVFVALAVLYWVMLYLLLGALYLGIGAQAGSVREVQTLSLPLTLVQLLFFGLASGGVGKPDGPVALAAAAVPWSSPFAMIARAVERPGLWPHALALAWQLACLAVVVRVAARLFRRNVLKSGPAPARIPGGAS